jgi:hypothetical protein
MIFESTRFAHWGTDLAALRNVDTDQVLWVLRMFALVLGVGACVYAVVHALGGMTASGRDREAINPALSESQGAGSQRQQLDAGTVKSWGWFSEPLESGAQLAEAPIPLEEAQELSLTKLNLRLEGIALGASPEVSLAIIEIDGKSERYTIGTKLPVGRNVYLRAIMRESVHLDNNGKLEELPLFAGDMMMPQRKVPASATSRLGYTAIAPLTSAVIIVLVALRTSTTVHKHPSRSLSSRSLGVTITSSFIVYPCLLKRSMPGPFGLGLECIGKVQAIDTIYLRGYRICCPYLVPVCCYTA